MLSRFLDRELGPAEVGEVEAHLVQCHDCRSLLETWSLQSEWMRVHLGRRRLEDEFVARVMQALPASTHGTANPARARQLPRQWQRWLPAAAAVLLAALAVVLFFANRRDVSYARVIEPGALEVRSSGGWVQATAGEILHPGMWLRNPTGDVPEILWHDARRVSLEAGTVAHIPDRSTAPANQLSLICGSLSSEIQPAGNDFRVSTPAGLVTATGRFTIRVANLALPQLQIEQDGSETLTGTMVPIGEVRVSTGTARVEISQATQEVKPGAAVFFSSSNFISRAVPGGAVDASLKVVAGGDEAGRLHASLHTAPEGISLQLDASNIGMKRLLQLLTDAEVRGGEDKLVSGRLRIPAQAEAGSIASAVGAAVGLPVSFRHERIIRAVAVGRPNPRQPTADSPAEYSVEKSRDGRLSFNFRSIPAGDVFQVLRVAANNLPDLSADTAAIPVSLQADGLMPEETAAWIEKELGLALQIEGHAVGVIEIGNASVTRPGVTDSGAARESVPQSRPSDGSAMKDQRLPTGGSGPPGLSQAEVSMQTGQIQAQVQVRSGRSLWSILSPLTMVPASPSASAVPPGGNSQSKGAVSRNKRQFLGAEILLGRPGASTHIIWPTLGLENAAGAEAEYVVTNHTATQAHALWNGYDPSGQLVAQYEYPVDGRSALALLPARDLPAFLGAGGHWETISNVPLAGTRGDALGDGLGAPAVSGQLKNEWEVRSAWLNLGARIWLANPGSELASVVISISRNGSTLTVEQMDMLPHAGAIWPGNDPVMGAGLTVTVSVRKGVVAFGLR